MDQVSKVEGQKHGGQETCWVTECDNRVRFLPVEAEGLAAELEGGQTSMPTHSAGSRVAAFSTAAVCWRVRALSLSQLSDQECQPLAHGHTAGTLQLPDSQACSAAALCSGGP